jgi:hypothetical protein
MIELFAKFDLPVPQSQPYSSMQLPNVGEMVNDAVSPEIQTLSVPLLAIVATCAVVYAFKH